MKVKLFNSPILRQTSVDVTNSELDTVEFKKLVQDMIETMYQEEGIGLAANQIGSDKAICVMDSSDPDEKGVMNKPRVFINPKITAVTAESVMIEESCLSIPGVFAQTERFKGVTVTYKTQEGNEVEEQLSDIEAVAIQHEVDHL